MSTRCPETASRRTGSLAQHCIARSDVSCSEDRDERGREVGSEDGFGQESRSSYWPKIALKHGDTQDCPWNAHSRNDDRTAREPLCPADSVASRVRTTGFPTYGRTQTCFEKDTQDLRLSWNTAENLFVRFQKNSNVFCLDSDGSWKSVSVRDTTICCTFGVCLHRNCAWEV